MSDDGKRLSIRKGGVVDGEQYYIVGMTDMTGEFGSVALTESQLWEYLDKATHVLEGQSDHAAVQIDHDTDD